MIKAKQFFYVMIAATVLGFGGIVGAFYWGDSMLNKRAAAIADLQTERDIASEKILALKKAKQSDAVMTDATTLLDRLLPKQKNQETLVADVIYTASNEAGIPVSSISTLSFTASDAPSDQSGTVPYKDIPGVLSYPFSMTVDNITYDTFLKLLVAIERNGRLVQIDELQISPDKNTPGTLTSVSLTMKAFLKP